MSSMSGSDSLYASWRRHLYPYGDVIYTPMEIISVTRGDDFRRLWGLSGRPVETISVTPP